MPDGTKVQLNGATTITYNVNNAKERLVQLSGEAFFDVVKNPDCPFRVIANDLQIEVVGTSFNVNTYKKNVIETSLLTGRIKISGGSLPQEYVLTPGKKATYSSIDKTLKITKADAHVITGWCDDYLIFDSEPLIDVIEEIERWYGENRITMPANWTRFTIRFFPPRKHTERYSFIEPAIQIQV